MITALWNMFVDSIEGFYRWLVIEDAFQNLVDKTPQGYVCPYCGKRRGRFDHCTGCGAE